MRRDAATSPATADDTPIHADRLSFIEEADADYRSFAEYSNL